MNTKFNKIKNISYKIVSGDLFDSVRKIVAAKNFGSSIIIPHVCNNIQVFGGGFTKDIVKYYPIVKDNFFMLGSKNQLGYTQFITAFKEEQYKHQIVFANMIAQNNIISKQNPRPLNYNALVKCMNDVKSFINNNFTNEYNCQIHAPKFGSGLAGGNWFFIEDLITDIWTNIPVFIYSNQKQQKIV